MAKLVFAMNQSLDGYVDHTKFGPSLALFRHLVDHVRELTGILYGRGPVRNHALLGRGSVGLGAARTRLRRGVAKQAEVGRIALARVRRPQRHACRG